MSWSSDGQGRLPRTLALEDVRARGRALVADGQPVAFGLFEEATTGDD